MQPYDPFLRFQDELTRDEANIALELCLRLLTAGIPEDLAFILERAEALLQQEPIDPLKLIYVRLIAEAEERRLLLATALEWAQSVDPHASSIDIEPAAWTVTLRIEGDETELRIEKAWEKMELDGEEVVIRITTEGGKVETIRKDLSEL